MAAPARLSIIIPTLNEEQQLPSCLDSIRRQKPSCYQVEVIVVDGGSQDATLRLATENDVDSILEGIGGRGAQLQLGAEKASGDVLLFLHADCQLPTAALQRIEHTLGDGHEPGPYVGGAFHVRHQASASSGWIVRCLLRVADWRSHSSRLPYGDQAVFVTAEAFRQIGGMPRQPLLEDLEFACRLRQIGRLAILPLAVLVSGRRFEQSPWRTVLCWRFFPLLYRLGVSPQRLQRWYGNVRAATE